MNNILFSHADKTKQPLPTWLYVSSILIKQAYFCDSTYDLYSPKYIVKEDHSEEKDI